MAGLSIFSMAVIGFLGSAHCMAMCGGIVSSLAISSQTSKGKASPLTFNLTYNFGRILSYSIAGAIAGYVGQQVLTSSSPIFPFSVSHLLSGIILILLGLYLTNIWRALVVLEKAGAYVWQYIRPLGQRFLPVTNIFQAFGLGVIWGWLPCGLVYSALAMASVSGSPQSGAFLMMAFGVGTLPALILMGRAATKLNSLVQAPVFRNVMGAAVLAFGLYTSFSAFEMMNGHHKGGHKPAPRVSLILPSLYSVSLQASKG